MIRIVTLLKISMLVMVISAAYAEDRKPIIGIPCDSKSVLAATGAKIDMKNDIFPGPLSCNLGFNQMSLLLSEKDGDNYDYFPVRCKYYKGNLPTGAYVTVSCLKNKVVSLQISKTGNDDMKETVNQKYGPPIKSGPMFTYEYNGKPIERQAIKDGASKVKWGTIELHKGRFPDEQIFFESFINGGYQFQILLYVDSSIVDQFIQYGKTSEQERMQDKKNQTKQATDSVL